MRNEPNEIEEMRDLMNTYDNSYSSELDPPSKYIILLTLFEYIDQLQGLLDGTLMYNNDDVIVPRVPIEKREAGDTWYTRITFRGFMVESSE